MIELARSRGVTALTMPIVLVGAALLVAACGGGGGASGGAGTSGGTPAARQSGAAADPQEAFRQCLRQHGGTLPNLGRPRGGPPSGRPTARPTGRPSGFPSMSQSQRQAFQACASLAPNGGRFGGGRFGGGVDQSALKAFQSCMSQHGVKVTNSGRPGGLRSATADPKTMAALRTCRALLPMRQFPSPSPSPTPSTS